MKKQNRKPTQQGLSLLITIVAMLFTGTATAQEHYYVLGFSVPIYSTSGRTSSVVVYKEESLIPYFHLGSYATQDEQELQRQITLAIDHYTKTHHGDGILHLFAKRSFFNETNGQTVFLIDPFDDAANRKKQSLTNLLRLATNGQLSVSPSIGHETGGFFVTKLELCKFNPQDRTTSIVTSYPLVDKQILEGPAFNLSSGVHKERDKGMARRKHERQQSQGKRIDKHRRIETYREDLAYGKGLTHREDRRELPFPYLPPCLLLTTPESRLEGIAQEHQEREQRQRQGF